TSAKLLAYTVALAADYQRALPSQFHIRRHLRAGMPHGGIDGQLPLLERRSHLSPIETMHERHTKQRSGGSSQCFRVERAHRALGEYDAGGAEGLGRAYDRARVARVLQPVQHDQRALPAKQLI